MNVFIMQNSIVRPLGRDMQNVLIGFVGEHEARTFFVRTRDDLTGYTVGLVIDDVDCGAMTKAPMPDGSTMLSLTLTSDMLGNGGDKVCQLLMVKNTIVRKSSQFRAYVGASNDINSTAPDSATIIIISEKITELVHEAALDAIEEVQEVIDSIPADYSALSGDVTKLKADLGDYASLSTSKRTTIPDNTDLNDLTTPGQYKVGTLSKARTIINIPYEIAGVLDVGTATSGTTIVQEYQTISSSRTGHMYRRTKSGDTWTDWVYCADSADIATLNSTLQSDLSALETRIGGAIDDATASCVTLTTSKRTTIPDNTDLNDLTTPGQYKVGTLAKAGTIINIPANAAGILDVCTSTSATYLIQTYTCMVGSKTGHIYRRTKSGSGDWTAWVYCVDSEDLSEMETGIQSDMTSMETRLLANIKGNNLSNIGTASAIPRFRLISGYVKTDVISDYERVDGIRYNQTQGIASDKNRYLFWCLRRPPVATGDSNPMLLRKWDTWRNESVVLNTNAPQAYGHAEDMEYIPKWCKGFDNGSVDRLYIVDMDRYAPNKTIHVVNADTLEYITSFETANLLPKGLASPEHWSGANHIAFEPMRGKIVLNSVFTPEGTVEHYVITAIYDKDGNFEKGLEFRRYAGTQLGMDCDENYIYIPNYESSPTVEGELDHYIYIFDWDLNPITRFMIDREFWEFEGIAHIGKKFYTSWIADQSSYGIRIVENQPLVTDYALSTTFPLHAWGDSDNFRLSTFRYINPSN